VGFLREFFKDGYHRKFIEIEVRHQGQDRKEVEAFLTAFATAAIPDKNRNDTAQRAERPERRLIKPIKHLQFRNSAQPEILSEQPSDPR
jgi:hypothetical protein